LQPRAGAGVAAFRWVNVKGNGQECPFHTGKSNVNSNVRNGAAGVRGSHPSQRTRRMGHPRLIRVRSRSRTKSSSSSRSRSESKATGRSVRSTLASLCFGDGRGARLYRSCGAVEESKVPRFARNDIIKRGALRGAEAPLFHTIQLSCARFVVGCLGRRTLLVRGGRWWRGG
jgi:hypothetical protein